METNNSANDSTRLIDTLIYNQSAEKSSAEVIHENEGQVLITTSRVVSIRYKIYVLVLLVLVGFFGYYYIQPAYDQFVATNTQLTNITADIGNFGTKKMQYDADTKLISVIDKEESQIISCLDYRIWCAELDPTIKNNFGVARSYIQINTLTDPKMFVDEKKILANINEYLIKKNSNDPAVISTSKNGMINSIAIGDPEPGVWILSSLPLRLTITFTDKDSLLSFINNVETSVLSDPNYRILYKLDEVSYDIVNYTNQQSVNILMHAYYIK